MDLPHDNFSNQALSAEQLPKINQLNQQPLAPIYPKVRLALTASIFSILLIIGVLILNQPIIPLPDNATPIIHNILLMIAILAVVILIYIYFADQKKSYALRELDLHFTSGLVFRKTVSQPILRIQHVELKRGPIDRKVGLAKLQVFSAGGALHTFEIPGLPVEDAESIRQFIISHKDANNG
ncbi:PH domain-containing protein [Thalassotalea profundi]|uniref:YdbS-like PH domain-containing protein n=1 Tax=Thalassotalea profundi TaxID=2036687 RepID=A0ABQ3ILH0_9GAMM|nr:PH domain-containing protein [Thalassotalea profundi]GHE87840.1 hypothetical protein GCM10011501_16740 [Thalassotalea profundi]